MLSIDNVAVDRGGVSEYIWGEYTVKVPFPKDKNGKEYRACAYCKYYSRYTSKCMLNDGVCYFPQTHIAPTCPLTFDDEEE